MDKFTTFSSLEASPLSPFNWSWS